MSVSTPIAAEKPQMDLFESERRFRLLVEGVTDYAIYMLDPTGIITNWNAGAERIKGYNAVEAIGHHYRMFYPPEDRSAGIPERNLEIARREGKYHGEGWRQRKDGTRFFASVAIDAIYDEGELVGFAKITRDLTERLDAQHMLERVQQQLAESQKMDALGQLTGGVAHDFNNLLMIVTGHIATLKNLAADDPKALRAAQAIEIAAQRGANLTRQLLTFARRQRLNPQAINVRSRIDSIREVLTSALGSAVRLEVDTADDLWPVQVDLSEFEIALVNLVINARDAMPGGGTVTIKANNVPRDKGFATGEYVAIRVEDNGVGIPDDIIGKVFEPFFTTKAIGKGTGLGLSQVHGFVHQAGGSVTIESKLNKGTVFTIYLPRSKQAPLAMEVSEQVPSPQQTGTVLLVEDNPEVATASTGLLEQLGYAVRWAQNAEIALQEMRKHKIDLVFSDVVMPGRLDGIGLAEAIKRKYPDMPILLATGYSDALQRLKAEFPVIRKPYQVHELGEALSQLRRD